MSTHTAARQAEDCAVEIDELTSVEGAAMLESVAQQRLGMSGADFREAVESGKFADTDDAVVTSASMLLPFVD